MAAFVGMRSGELYGVGWSAVDCATTSLTSGASTPWRAGASSCKDGEPRDIA
jgi:hypothetical protein